jgi:hypothetical protein
LVGCRSTSGPQLLRLVVAALGRSVAALAATTTIQNESAARPDVSVACYGAAVSLLASDRYRRCTREEVDEVADLDVLFTGMA